MKKINSFACLLLIAATAVFSTSCELRTETLGELLILTTAADGKVLALLGLCGGLVEVARNLQLVGETLTQLAGQLGTLLQRDAGYRYERAHVGGTEAGVCAMVLAHIDELASLLDCTESSLTDVLGRADKRHHGAVGGLTRIDIEELDALDRLDLAGNLVNHVHVAALGKVGDTLYNSYIFHVRLVSGDCLKYATKLQFSSETTK